MERIESNRQTRILDSNTRSSLPIYRKLSRTMPLKSHSNTEIDNYKQRNRYNKYLHAIAATTVSVITCSPVMAADVGAYDINTAGSAFSFSESWTQGAAVNAIGSGADVTSGVVADLPAYGEVLTMSGGVAGSLAGTITSAGVTTLTAGGAGTTATGQFVTEIVIE